MGAAVVSAWTFWLGLTMLGAGAACGETTSAGSGPVYPNKSIRVVTSSPASGGDINARLIAQAITAPLGQQVLVENRPSGVIPGEIVAHALPDGYTLLLYPTSLWVAQLLRDKMPYDVIRDFAPVSLTNRAPMVLVTNLSLPANSVRELIALARNKPGALNYASPSIGAAGHLAAELFKSMAGVNIVRIPYKSVATQLADLISGQVQISFATPGAVTPHVKSGRLRALAVTGAQPFALLPGLPTIAASGLPGFESESNTGMFAPARTPESIIRRLNLEIVRALNQSDVREKFFATGVEPVGSSPAQFAAKIKSEMTRLGKVIKDAGIRDEQE